MPFNQFRGGVAVELIAHVDQALDGGHVDVVHGAKVEDHGAEDGAVVVQADDLAAARPGVIPGAVLSGCEFRLSLWQREKGKEGDLHQALHSGQVGCGACA